MSILGQNPADAANGLRKSQNLLDVPDKAAARNNLDVPSKSEVAYAGVPIGTIIAYYGSIAPSGYLPCSGQTVTSGAFPALVTFLGGTTSATLPDLRGEFLRGWDNGRGVDAARANLSTQGHLANTFGRVRMGSGYTAGINTDVTIPTDGSYSIPLAYDWVSHGIQFALTGTETRPRNVSVLYCIKAYESVQNYTSSLNFAGIVSDYSTLLASAAKYSDFNGANQSLAVAGFQKLPGGLVMQWGYYAGTLDDLTALVNFPTTFPSVCLNVSVTPEGPQSAGGNYCAAGAVKVSTSQFRINGYGTGQATVGYHWVALGY